MKLSQKNMNVENYTSKPQSAYNNLFFHSFFIIYPEKLQYLK